MAYLLCTDGVGRSTTKLLTLALERAQVAAFLLVVRRFRRESKVCAVCSAEGWPLQSPK